MSARVLAAAALLVMLTACASVRPGALPSGGSQDARLADGPLLAETPLQADAFVDSIGVNTHLLDDLVADREYAIVTKRMQELGVRHIRDGIFPGQTPRQYAAERDFLKTTGARMEAITDCPQPLGYYPHSQTPPAVIRSFDAALGGRVELVEGPNEPDLRKVRGWAPLLTACIEHLKLNRALDVPFVAPAMGNAFNARKLGNIAQLVNIGAIHRYFSGHKPGTNGFWKSDACGMWGQMSFYVCEARINAGPQAPLFITETGYTTFGEIDEKTGGKYLSRVLLIDSLAGIERTYIYELHDDGTSAANSENGYGLFRYDGTPKPSFNAVRSEIAMLSDPGPAFAPAALSFRVSGPGSIRHELFQKRDGTYVLAVWNETESWNPNRFREIPVAPATVVVTFASTPRVLSFETLDDEGRPKNRPASAAGSKVSMQIDDHVSFLRLRAP
jgi:hypothetical protein